MLYSYFFFVKQKTAYEMRISDWSSDVCSSDLALTAMALIFAVFLTNPAPICVLDEVDAPLDDHNVERYCNLMDEMAASTETRFVIITHNPITMARMNRLFGVTIAEQGVSPPVSVDLQPAGLLPQDTPSALSPQCRRMGK